MAVLLNTSLGDIVIDLHVDQCPLTSKNFLKLSKLKYYNNCLFHDVKKDFIAQTGDPTGTGSGGDSVYKHLYGDQARFFNDEIHPKFTHDKIGTVAMASAGENLNASQFYITLRDGLDYLDGKHTVKLNNTMTVFGEVAEGLETLMRINEAYVDDKGRPFKNIRIKHVDILEDPFDDPPQLEGLVPDQSPEIKPPAEGEEVRLEDDWVPMDEQMDPEELDKSLRKKEAHSRAVVLEMIGDIPEAEVAPPENVLFICKLNPVTEEGDLETIFARFGKIISADIIRDYKTGESLCYGFIEFENKDSCEAAYFKMDNVLIDDRRIHVDFSQSVARLWTRFRKFGSKDTDDQGAGRAQGQAKGGGCFNCGEYGHLKKDCPFETNAGTKQDSAPVEKPKYTLKESGGQRGNPRNRYEMVFGEHNEDSHSNTVEASGMSKASHSMTRRVSKHRLEESDDGRRAQSHFIRMETSHDRNYRSGMNDRPRHKYADDRAGSDHDSRRSGPPFSSQERASDRRNHLRRNDRHRDRYSNEIGAQPSLSSREKLHDRRDYSEVAERSRKRNDTPDSDFDTPKRSRKKNDTPDSDVDTKRSRKRNDTLDSDVDTPKRSRKRNDTPDSDDSQKRRSRRRNEGDRLNSDDPRKRSRKRNEGDRPDSDVDTPKRAQSPSSGRDNRDGRKGQSAKAEQYRVYPPKYDTSRRR